MKAREGKWLPKGTQLTTNGLDLWVPSFGFLLAIPPNRLSLLAHCLEHQVTSDLNTYHQLFSRSHLGRPAIANLVECEELKALLEAEKGKLRAGCGTNVWASSQRQSSSQGHKIVILSADTLFLWTLKEPPEWILAIKGLQYK